MALAASCASLLQLSAPTLLRRRCVLLQASLGQAGGAAAASAPAATPAAAAAVAAAAPAGGSAALGEYDALLTDKLAPFMAAASSLGGEVLQSSKLVERAFQVSRCCVCVQQRACSCWHGAAHAQLLRCCLRATLQEQRKVLLIASKAKVRLMQQHSSSNSSIWQQHRYGCSQQLTVCRRGTLAPAQQPEPAALQGLLQRVAEPMMAAGSLADNRRSPAFQQLKVVAEALQGLSWLAYTGPSCGEAGSCRLGSAAHSAAGAARGSSRLSRQVHAALSSTHARTPPAPRRACCCTQACTRPRSTLPSAGMLPSFSP